MLKNVLILSAISLSLIVSGCVLRPARRPAPAKSVVKVRPAKVIVKPAPVVIAPPRRVVVVP